VSLRKPKLTNLRKSEKTSRFGANSAPDLEESDPVGGPLAGGTEKPPKILSEALEPLLAGASKEGMFARLPVGLIRACV